MRMLRKFHLDSFPDNRIWIKFNADFRKTFFREFRFKEVNELFKGDLRYSSFKQWEKGNCSIPLWFVLKVSKHLEIPIAELEKKIMLYQGPSTSTPILNPKLPLVEDGRLVRIITHILCDGWVSGAAGTNLPKGKGPSGYRNFNRTLIDKFEEDLSVFGEFKLDKDYKHGHILFPNVIQYILEKIYKIKFGTFQGRLPKGFWYLSKHLIKEVIMAFGDDEGHVYDHNIDFYSMNKLLVGDLRNLFNYKFPGIKVSKIKTNLHSAKNPKYSISVLSGSFPIFKKEIGFYHPLKMKDLEFNVERMSMKQSRIKGLTKGRILDLLKENKLSAKELSRKTNVCHAQTLWHLNNLKEEGKIKIIDKGKFNTNLWGLNNVTN